MNENNLSFSKKVLIFISLSSLIILLLLFLGYVAQILLLIFAGILLAVLLRALSGLLQKLIPVSESLSLLFVVIGLFLLISGFSLILGPNLVEGINSLSKQIPSSLEKLESEVKKLPWGDMLVENVKNSGKELFNNPELMTKITGFFSSAISGIVGVVVFLVIGLYCAYDPGIYTKNFLKLIPKKKQKRASEIIGMLGEFISLVDGRSIFFNVDFRNFNYRRLINT